MVAAQLLQQADSETLLDIYDRHAYILHGVSRRTHALREIALAAVDLCIEVEGALADRAEQEANQGQIKPIKIAKSA